MAKRSLSPSHSLKRANSTVACTHDLRIFSPCGSVEISSQGSVPSEIVSVKSDLQSIRQLGLLISTSAQ